MKLKEEILNLITKNKITDIIPQIPISHTDIQELDINDILYLCIPVINGKYYDQIGNKIECIEQYKEFIINIEDQYKWSKLNEVYKNMNSTRLISRNDKIYMYNIKKSFRFDYIDWDDREWIYSLIEYLYILCIEEIHILKMEIEIIKEMGNNKNYLNIKDDILNMKDNKNDILNMKDNKNDILNIKDNKNYLNIKDNRNYMKFKEDRNIKRNDILINRIKSKYTLDQFADKLLKQIQKKENNEKDIKINEKEDDKEEKEDIVNMRIRDELNDDRHVSKGNTDNVG